MQKLGKRHNTEVTLQVRMQLLALHHEAGPAARAELITTDQKVLGGEHQGQTAWGHYGGQQPICHKELIKAPGVYATESRVDYVMPKTRQSAGRGLHSWCSYGSSQVLEE